MSFSHRCSWTSLPVFAAGFAGIVSCEQSAPSDAKQRVAKTLCESDYTNAERKPTRMKEIINHRLNMGR